MHPKRHQGKRVQLEQRRARVAALYLQGFHQWEIGAQVGVDAATICRDLKAIREQWRASAVRDFDEAKAQELARIDALEREYWAAWTASRENREITSTEQVDGASSSRFKAAVRKEAREGNPAFLAGVQWCVTRRCALLGLDAPQRSELTGKDGRALHPTVLHIVEKVVTAHDSPAGNSPAPGSEGVPAQ